MRTTPRTLSRRHTLALLSGATAAATCGLPAPLRAAENPTPTSGTVHTLRMQRASAQLLPSDEPATEVWAYNGSVPGPILRLPQGETLKVKLLNDLDQPSSIHWHGIRIDNRMDGVVGLTQEAVAPGESFDYSFTVPDAGTYWYHPHNRSWEQVARGLYGVLVVDEAEAPQVDRDLVLVVDDWRLDGKGQIDEASMGALHDWAHGGRLGNVLTLNGQDIWRQPVRAGERVRLRLISTANARVMRLRLEDHEPWLVALDGHPVPPTPLVDGRITLAPGQRADLMIDMMLDPGAFAAITEVSAGGRLEAGGFAYHPQEVARANPLDAPLALPAGKLPARVDTAGALEVSLLMEGGAMGGMTGALHKGQMQGPRELAANGLVWAFNGVASHAMEPLFEVERGRPVALRMVNRTAWPHAMHLHGHHAQTLSASASTPWRDTHFLEPEEEQTIVFAAENPGNWMLHCHMLEHQAGGMATWFKVRG